jgi:hypothetical protein
MEGAAWMPLPPRLHLRVLVRGVIVDGCLDGLVGRYFAVNGIEEADELLVPVALHAAADHLACQHVECREQCRGAVTLVVMRHGPAAAGLERQPRLGAVKRLDLALFIDRQHDRMIRWVEIEANHVDQLVGELWIARPLERADPMRLKPMCLPDALYRAQRDSHRCGHGASGPARGLTPRLAAGQRHHARYRLGRQRRRAGLARLVAQQAIDTLLGETLLPPPGHRTADADPGGDLLHRPAFGRCRNHLRSFNVPALTIAVTNDRFQPPAVRSVEDDAYCLGHAARVACRAAFVNHTSASEQ